MSKLKKDYVYPLDLGLDLIGGKWKLRILYHLTSGTKRFSELRKLLEGITEATLTVQLRELEGAHLIERKIYPEVPLKVEYSLSEYGMELKSVLADLCKWSKKYARENEINIH
ncbi:winged helix-turn-helix transcriptional regulator [Cellulosilyticum lentocellum]|uniref:Transcriptional regulator, HxlR family n=1 Tax=Cellulosilyticum lentocellum (strain ATCC 49066 / DSM 5427 / NCIMB 11756 / RHM5) TaxID=642492 RepID=F2JHY2_CELLD|nr:winged helix-turn-helix transcriptional regulator [Cellulosilyticum lentocellum]ADZ81926.1 transcriptional regulator, HxlR family [Cellulosilyticum lentocellum DSM 5427]